MNRAMVAYISGRILLLVAALMTPTLLVSLYYGEGWQLFNSTLVVILLTFAVGMVLSFKKPMNTKFYVREGLVITSLCWLFLAVFGALPFYMSGVVPSFVDAVFESASGFTTTGSSILTDVESVPRSILYWRSFTHFVGGMGVLVFALAVLPDARGQDVHLMKAEVPGPSFGKLVSRLKETARLLYVIYAVFTAVLFITLIIAGMTPFDALLHAMATAGTGGFSTYNASVAAFESPLIEYVLAVGMLIFGVNFYLYYFALRGNIREALKNEELRWYGGIVAVATLLLVLSIYPNYAHFSDCFRDAFFTVSTIITTTGFGTVDFTKWPLFAQLIILLLMFTGACAGSTAGGFKVGRVVRLFKIVRAQFQRTGSPRRITPVIAEGKPMNDQAQHEIGSYLMAYILMFFAILLIVSLDAVDFETAFGAVAGTFNNIGPGLGAVGPKGNFAGLSALSKITLSVGMIAGRLEIFPILILFAPSTWRTK